MNGPPVVTREARRVMREPEVATTAVALELGPPPVDEVQRAIHARIAADARAEGYEEGYRAGAAEGESRAAGLVDAVERAVEVTGRRVAEALHEHVDGIVDLALAIAGTVVGHVPPDDASRLAARIREAMACIDDAPLTVHVHPDDVALVREALGAVDVALSPDPDVVAGEAVVAGPWARAELTRQAAWDAVREVLDAYAD